MSGAQSDVGLARDILWLALGQPGGYHVLERQVEGQFARLFISTGGARRGWWQRSIAADDAWISAAPHPAKDGWPGTEAGALWMPVESGKTREALRFFKPRPTVLLQAGDTVRQWAIWALKQPLAARFVVELNRRVAHRLKAPKKLSGLDAMLPAPGTVLRHGREKSPLLVRVVECREEFHSARAVAGWLPQSPDPEAWKDAA